MPCLSLEGRDPLVTACRGSIMIPRTSRRPSDTADASRVRGQDRCPRSAGSRRRQLVPDFRAPAYASLAPVSRISGTSTRGERPPKGANTHLQRAMFLAAFASLSAPVSRTCYQRKRDQGKRHNAALIRLARRRCDVLFAMLRNGTTYQPPTHQAPPNAA
ncbi:hypothetical protein Acsp04_66130 [Actinomadura sp. NBRC 104425]|nr:hypothetical protein Acsp04_66130 [Actinomadura sp. NBRC 104425]